MAGADEMEPVRELGEALSAGELARVRSQAAADRADELRASCVCDLTGDDFNVTGPTISHHLKTLREAGLIDGERRGTWVYYRPVKENLRQLGTLLAMEDADNLTTA